MIFPDLARLRAGGVNVVELPMADVTAFIKLGSGYLQKLGLAAGEQMRKGFIPAALNPDWAALHERDVKLGAIYRAALAQQGIAFPALAAPAK